MRVFFVISASFQISRAVFRLFHQLLMHVFHHQTVVASLFSVAAWATILDQSCQGTKVRRECLIQNFGNTIPQKFPLALVDSSVNLIELAGIGNSTGQQSTVRAQPKWTTFCGPYSGKHYKRTVQFHKRKVMFVLVAQQSRAWCTIPGIAELIFLKRTYSHIL